MRESIRVEHREGFFKGVRDADIYYQCWLPGDDDPRAVLLIVHGLGEHSGRYMNVVEHFVPLGYAVYGFDHLGHGRSGGMRMHVKQFTDYTEPLQTYSDMVRDWHPGAPVFLLGHSLGGLIVSYYLLDQQDDLAGAVLSGPSVAVPEGVSSLTILIGKVLSALAPRARLVGVVDPAGICCDPQVVEAYVDDPLVHIGRLTARLGVESLKAQQRVEAEAARIALPVLIIQGGADRLVDPAGAQMLYDTVRSRDKTLKVYDGFHHELHNEPGRAQVLGDVEAWLEAHI